MKDMELKISPVDISRTHREFHTLSVESQAAYNHFRSLSILNVFLFRYCVTDVIDLDSQ